LLSGLEMLAILPVNIAMQHLSDEFCENPLKGMQK
jgi:hypothetical protein